MAKNILDTTVLSNFAIVRRPDLLRLAIGENSATTPTVMAELGVGESAGRVPRCDWAWLPILKLSSHEVALAATLSAILGAGESECIAVALSRDAVLLSDDFSARRLAQSRNLRVSGTLGVLLLLHANDHVSLNVADALLAAMVAHGYRSPVTTLQDLV